MEEVQSHLCKNLDVSQTLKKMYNNKKYSDTVFLVNKTKFHASSHLVSVSSEVLESLLEDNFENCGDRKIKIGEIKYETSFSVVLQYMYGLEIDLSEVNEAVLCETLCLAESYGLTSLVLKLKSFLCQLDSFEIDTLVPLLNTSKQFLMEELYKELKRFAFKKANIFVRHSSFNDLQYNILLDLVASNFFSVDEIDILKGVLNWHDSNIINSLPNEESWSSCDSINGLINQEEAEDQTSMARISAVNDVGAEVSIPTQADASSRVLKTFASNVLKTILSHIRFEQISAVCMLKFSSTELFRKYKVFLTDLTYCSGSKERRNQLQFCEDVLDVTKEFTVKWRRCGVLYKSNSEVIGDMNWEIGVRVELVCDHTKLSIQLNCSPCDASRDQNCSVNFRITLISDQTNQVSHLVIPGKSPFIKANINSEFSYKKIHNFYIIDSNFSAFNWKTDNSDSFKFKLELSMS